MAMEDDEFVHGEVVPLGERGIDTQFKKGEGGRTKGSKNFSTVIAETISGGMKRRDGESKKELAYRAIASKFSSLVNSQDENVSLRALNSIMDRMDGKPVQKAVVQKSNGVESFLDEI